MTVDWSQLDAELDRWAASGLTLPLWWRDDDAVAPGPALERLQDMATQLDLPLHLAVIPARAEPTLAAALAPHTIPVVHGWAHVSHAPDGAKNAEFGAHRSLTAMSAEAAAGLQRLRRLFGPRMVPMFVPPWNRIAPGLPAELAGAGYRMLSTFTPRDAPFAAPGLARINTHLDPIAWRAGRSLADPDMLIAQLVRQLAARRTGEADNAEPYGVLTHHLVHDDAIWKFTEQLLTRLRTGPVRPWAATDDRRETNEPT
ncbi:polysaccharide deacetylase family protein [Sedimentitalea sp. HM32M-2]|uniref:polysaccharide deacetylase family protein n=1 Tax=Sedimentitalea sp. HM32M-2 TaxID=3351566 RepID=UPI00362C42DA